MIGDALAYPRRGENWLERVGIGGGLSLLAFVIPLLPQLVVFGHAKRVIARTVEGNPDPPEFDDWEGLFVDGVKLYAVVLVYTIVPMVVLSIAVGVLWVLFVLVVGVLGSAGGEGAAGALGVVGTIGMLGIFAVVSLLFVAIYYFVPAGMVRFAAEDDIGAAFDLDGIRRLSLSGEYFRAWAAAFVVGLGMTFVSTLLLFTVVGILAVPFVQFYVQMGVFHLFGTAYAEVEGTRPAPGADPTPTAGDDWERR